MGIESLFILLLVSVSLFLVWSYYGTDEPPTISVLLHIVDSYYNLTERSIYLTVNSYQLSTIMLFLLPFLHRETVKHLEESSISHQFTR